MFQDDSHTAAIGESVAVSARLRQTPGVQLALLCVTRNCDRLSVFCAATGITRPEAVLRLKKKNKTMRALLFSIVHSFCSKTLRTAPNQAAAILKERAGYRQLTGHFVEQLDSAADATLVVLREIHVIHRRRAFE